MSDESPEFDAKVASVAENPEQRCPCILLLDVSGSMSGAPIASLNNGLQTFRDSIRKMSWPPCEGRGCYPYLTAMLWSSSRILLPSTSSMRPF